MGSPGALSVLVTAAGPMADTPSGKRGPLAEVRRLSPTASLANQGAGALRDMILNGVLAPGSRLNEVELSSALGISRAPLREAIRDLASQGLLTIVTHKGAFVPSYTAVDLQEIYQARIAIESHAVRLVAMRRSQADLDELNALLDRTEQEVTRSGSRAYPDGLDFHSQVIELTGNHHLKEISTSVGRKIHLARSRSGRRPERAQEALREHREIVSCMASDAGAAAILMMRHLQLSLASVLQVADTSAESDAGFDRPAAQGGTAS
jgi:DNA-binding GntR family transcriptional regulator